MANYSDFVTDSGVKPTYRAENYTAVPNDMVWVGSDAGTYTITLPASPVVGVSVWVGDAGDNALTNNITVGRNGNTINGLSEDFVLDVDGGSVWFTWSGTTWKYSYFVSQGLTQAQVDARVVTVGNTDLKTVTVYSNILLDDTAWSYDFGKQIFNGDVTIVSNDGVHSGIFGFRAADTNTFMSSIADTGVNTTTGVLSGTTGSDGTTTISAHSDYNIYIENRTGLTKHFNITINSTWI